MDRESARREQGHSTGFALTAEAVDVITRAAARVPTLPPDWRPEPQEFSAALGWIMATLLRDTQDTAARRILDELDLLDHASGLTAIHDNAGPSALRFDLPPR